uniref:Uncharacterized protein n=1 Tax=Sus scrofa TaxID=9823 RepID=A0A8D0TDZ2_PIG
MAPQEEKPIFEEENKESGGGAEVNLVKDFNFFKNYNIQCKGLGMIRILILSWGIFLKALSKSSPLKSYKVPSTGRQGQVQIKDTIFLIGKDPGKFAEVRVLFAMNEELKLEKH